ncbi:MAG: hypothetical protein SPJ27_07770 [Candidatus Onthovivens sp.]|nr:hypothetical protein [Candidatus Onthovivens sp.]
MLNRLDANIIDTYNLNSSFSYLGEEDTDKSTNGTPVPDKMKEDGKRKGVIGKIGGIGADSNEPTRNGRRYPLELWQNVEKSEYFIEGMENRCIVGECDHPAERLDYSIPEGAIVLTKYDIQNDGKVYTEFDILDTLPGRTLKTYFDAGCKLGVSSRGLGEEIMVDGEKIIDPETYQFYCFDAVVFPAVKSARMELIESTSPKKQQLINSITKEINNCKTLDECLFIENMSKDTNLYLDEIKELLESKKEELSKDDKKDDTQDNTYELAKSIVDKIDKKTNKTKEDSQLSDFLKAWLGESKESITDLFNQLKESMTDGYIGQSWDEVIDKLKQDGYKIDSAYIEHGPQNEENVLLYKDGKTYTANVNKYYDGGYEILRNTIKEENNKIKISGSNDKSDEDTTDKLERNPDDNLEILAELQEKLSAGDSKINSLNIQLEQKNSVIRNLLSKINQNKFIISENAKNNSLLSNSLEELNFKIVSLESKLTEKSKEYTKLESLYKNLQKVNFDFSNMVEGLRLECIKNNNLQKTYIHKINKIKAENKDLKESIKLTNKKDSDSIEQLNENVSILQNVKDKLLKENDSFKLEDIKNKQLIEQLTSEKKLYQKKYIESLDKYIEQVCKRYNLKESTLRRLLGKSYSIADIDSVAKDLYENMTKINSLPFRTMKPERQLYVENIGLHEDGLDKKDQNEMLETFDFLANIKNK